MKNHPLNCRNAPARDPFISWLLRSLIPPQSFRCANCRFWRWCHWSLAPDLIDFLPLHLGRRGPHSHSPVGTLLLDLPFGYAVLLALLLLQHTLAQPLWEPHRSLFAHALRDYFARRHCWLIAMPSLLIGSWTHIVWDRFTHDTFWAYRNLPVLYRPLFPDSAHQLPLFHALQYVTSVLGLGFMAWCYWQAMQQAHADSPRTVSGFSRKIYLLAGLTLAALLLGMLRMQLSDFYYYSIYQRLSLVLKTAMVSFGLLYLLAGLILSRLHHQH
jgi:hypothetical protein